VTDRGDRLYQGALTLLTLVYLGLFGYYLGATTIRVPVYDLLGWILRYASFLQDGDWWNYFWQPHNEHRLVFSRALLLIDIHLFDGTTMPFLVFSFLCLAAMTAVLVREVVASELPAGFKSTLALAVLLLLATTYIVVDCSMPALGVYVHTAAFFTLALVLLDGAGEGGRHARLRRLLALPIAAAASFGISGGLIAWPVLLWAAWRGGLGSRWLIAIALAGAAVIAFYLYGLHSRATVGALEPLRMLRMLDYSIRFLGLPWSHSPALVWPSRIIGALILAGGLFVLVRSGLLTPRPDRLTRIAVGLLLFALLMAALAGAGRVDVATDREMPIRYSIFTAMAHLGLLFAAAPWLARRWTAPGHRRGLQAAVLGLAALLLAQQVVAGQAARRVASAYTEAYRDFASGLWTPEMINYIHPDRAAAERGRAIVKKLGIYQSY
jgi:hypothetical protein